MKSRNTPRPRTIKRTKKQLTPASKRKPKAPSTTLPAPPLSSVNIAKILSGFLTFRSSVKELSQSIQKIENIMDSAVQMFEIASKVIRQNHSNMPLPLPPGEQTFLPLSSRKRSKDRSFEFSDEDIPIIDFPELDERYPAAPGSSIFSNINWQQILSLISSPFVQRLITQLFKPKSSPTISKKSIKKKRG